MGWNKMAKYKLKYWFEWGCETPFWPHDNYTSDENILYLFEKGYYKYSWYDDMSKNNRI